MKPILMDNAFEAWAAAIRYCNDIKDGKATLQYQKNFVSSLHNAVELIMKQMLLNNNDHSVAEVRKPKNEAEAKLLLDYFKASDLNRFFESLSDDELLKFYTIPFNELISSHKKIFGDSLKSGETLKTELELLQRLRNDETHFMIRQDSFLSEGDFRTLHNFMVRFYKIIKNGILQMMLILSRQSIFICIGIARRKMIVCMNLSASCCKISLMSLP